MTKNDWQINPQSDKSPHNTKSIGFFSASNLCYNIKFHTAIFLPHSQHVWWAPDFIIPFNGTSATYPYKSIVNTDSAHFFPIAKRFFYLLSCVFFLFGLNSYFYLTPQILNRCLLKKTNDRKPMTQKKRTELCRCNGTFFSVFFYNMILYYFLLSQ